MRTALICAAVVAAVAAPGASAAPAEPVEVVCDVLGSVGEGPVECRTTYDDADGDGFGDPSTARRSPLPPDEGRIEVGGDCDDTDADVHPGAVESYDGMDEDCDGDVDEVVLVVTELMVNPRAVADTAGEYVEIRNSSDEPVDLHGVVVRVGGRDCAVPTALGGDAAIVVARSADPAVNGGLHADTTCPMTLTNSGGVVSVLASTGVLDTVDYTGFAVPDGASLNLDPSATQPTSNDEAGAWCAASTPLPSGDRGTPGSHNDTCP